MVGTGSGVLELLEVQPEGKGRQAAVTGPAAPDSPGERLGEDPA
jgi:hypothetical protein